MRKIVWIVALLSAMNSLSAQTTVKGMVYNDRNGNGRKDGGEEGIPDVAVTNGREVVLTDKNGAWLLPVGTDHIISVIKPAGFSVPLSADNLPQFFYIHKPKGSPALKFKGVGPTGKLPSSVDFALRPAAEENKFRMLLFGDPQVYMMEEVDYFTRGVIAEVENVKNTAFGLSLGDLVGNNPGLFEPYIRAVKKTGIPWYNLLGNHDLNFDAVSDSLADESFEAHFGPANYAFNYGKVHFIVLDDVLYPDPRGGKGYWGGFRPDQLEFIENDLKYVPEDRLVVLAYHIPVYETGGNGFRDDDRKKLFSLLKRYPHTLSLSAHIHNQSQHFLTDKDGWERDTPHHEYNAGTTSGNWYSGELNDQGIPLATMTDGTPKGYAFISFNGNRYKINYKVAGRNSDYQMEIFAPKVVKHRVKNPAGIYVNFFMGAAGDTVEYRIDNEQWKLMQYVEDKDPSFLHILHTWDYSDTLLSGRRPGPAADCQHLWKADIPAFMKPGEHVIEVRAKDMFGQLFSQKRTYRIEEAKR